MPNSRWFIRTNASPKESKKKHLLPIPTLFYTQARRPAFGSPMPCYHGPENASAMRTIYIPSHFLPHGRSCYLTSTFKFF